MELACKTRIRLIYDNFVTPFGCSSVRNGCGPAIRKPLGGLMGTPLALLQVPHGGAANIPTQFGDLSQVQHRSRPDLVVRSAISTRPAFFCLMWSTPNEAGIPNCCSHAVTRAEPAQNSMMDGSLAVKQG